MGKKDTYSLKGMQDGIAKAFSKVKDELTEHLDAINQNTGELNSFQQQLIDIEGKIDKLSERIDELTHSKTTPHTIPETIELTIREQEVFLALYTSEQKKSSVQIAKYIGLTPELVATHINKLVAKGIPILRQVSRKDDEIYFLLETKFKDLQARKTIINLNDDVKKEFSHEEHTKL